MMLLKSQLLRNPLHSLLGVAELSVSGFFFSQSMLGFFEHKFSTCRI
jgi:hypothetical protein